MITINVNLIGFLSNKNVGTLIYTKRLFSQIFKMKYKDFRFVFYAQEHFDFSDFNLPEGTEIIRVPNMKSPMIRRLYEHTLFRFKLKKADYIFTPYTTIPLFITRCKQIVTIHDMVPFVLSNKYGSLKLGILKLEALIAAKLAYMIVTVSNNSKSDICRITNIDDKKVHVIYNFIRNDEKVVQGKNNVELVKDYGICKPYFLTVATLQPGKNLERLIRSFKKFLEKEPGFQLCIVGNKGWGFASIFDEVKKYNLQDDIVFTGYVDDETLDVFYSHCYGVIYVSLYEGFGIPPLEGFYHNKSAVVSNNSSLPEVVGNAAIMVNPTDDDSISKGMNEFINKKDELQCHIMKQMDVFKPEIIVREFLNLF